jgi:large subunit ribosomal protein L18
MKSDLRINRKRRIRAKVSGTAERPRLVVFRSLRNISVQAVDDVKGMTLAAASLTGTKIKNTVAGAEEVGMLIAKKCAEKKIANVVFDRGGYKYHGKVKAVADGARKGGLKF